MTNTSEKYERTQQGNLQGREVIWTKSKKKHFFSGNRSLGVPLKHLDLDTPWTSTQLLGAARQGPMCAASQNPWGHNQNPKVLSSGRYVPLQQKSCITPHYHQKHEI